MATNKKEQQVREVVNQSSSILIALPYRPNTDAIASSLALATCLEKMGKRVKIVSHQFQLPTNHAFLPKSDEIYSDLTTLKKFIISVSLAHAAVEELSYAIENDSLHIYLTPKNGHFEQRDVATSDSDYSYDCILTLDAHDLESLGPLYEHNTEFFYSTPIVNISHAPQNDHFGQINLVNITATSTSEIVFEMIESWGEDLLDEYIATSLLTGMISKTKSFQSGSVTPRSLAIASHLIDQGARRDEIVKHLYQSKSVDVLKLWGKVLSRLSTHEDFPIVWSRVNMHDFVETKTSPQDLSDVVDELIINTPEAKNVCIFYPHTEGTPNESQESDKQFASALISTAPFVHAKEIFADFEPEGTDHFIMIKKTELTALELEKICIERIAKEYEKTTRL